MTRIFKRPENKNYLESFLPEYLEEDIKRALPVVAALEAGNKNDLPSCWDCILDELNSSINCAEVEGQISEEQAWYLREKYLGREKKWNT